MHNNNDINTYRKGKTITLVLICFFWRLLRQLLYMKMHVPLEMLCGYFTGKEGLMLNHEIQEDGCINLIKSEKKVVLSKQACMRTQCV